MQISLHPTARRGPGLRKDVPSACASRLNQLYGMTFSKPNNIFLNVFFLNFTKNNSISLKEDSNYITLHNYILGDLIQMKIQPL